MQCKSASYRWRGPCSALSGSVQLEEGDAGGSGEPVAQRGGAGDRGPARAPGEARTGKRSAPRRRGGTAPGDEGARRDRPSALRATRSRCGWPAHRRESQRASGGPIVRRLPTRARLHDAGGPGGLAGGRFRGRLALRARGRIGGDRPCHPRAAHDRHVGRARRCSNRDQRPPPWSPGAGAGSGHPRGAAADPGPADRSAGRAQRDRQQLRRPRRAARGGPGRSGGADARARAPLRRRGAAAARGGSIGRPRADDRRHPRSGDRATPGHRGGPGAVRQRRRGHRPAGSRLRRGTPPLLDGALVRRDQRHSHRARQGAGRTRARGSPAATHE